MIQYSQDDYIKYKLQKAKKTIAEVKILVENRYWNTAINRMYYACYYAVGALLIKNGIETSSYSGTRQKFGQLFIQTGKISKKLGKHYTELFTKRHKGDYIDFLDFDEETVLRLLPPSNELIKKIEELLKE